MDTVIYLILFFVVIALLLFGAYETLPKIHKLNKTINQKTLDSFGGDKKRIDAFKSGEKKLNVVTGQYVILAIVATAFVLSIIFPEMANNYLIIVLFVLEAIYIFLGLKLPSLEKKHGEFTGDVLKKRLQAIRLTFFAFIGFFVAVDVLILIIELLFSQNIRLL